MLSHPLSLMAHFIEESLKAQTALRLAQCHTSEQLGLELTNGFPVLGFFPLIFLCFFLSSFFFFVHNIQVSKKSISDGTCLTWFNSAFSKLNLTAILSFHKAVIDVSLNTGLSQNRFRKHCPR